MLGVAGGSVAVVPSEGVADGMGRSMPPGTGCDPSGSPSRTPATTASTAAAAASRTQDRFIRAAALRVGALQDVVEPVAGLDVSGALVERHPQGGNRALVVVHVRSVPRRRAARPRLAWVLTEPGEMSRASAIWASPRSR